MTRAYDDRGAARLRGLEPSAVAPPPSDLVSTSAAARLVGVDRNVINAWTRYGYLEPAVSNDGQKGKAALYRASDVREVHEWYGDTVTEDTAAKIVGVTHEIIERWGEEGRLLVWRYGTRRRYLREDCEHERDRRARLVSLAEASRRYRLPAWLVQRAARDGILPFEEHGTTRLIDPADLGVLLETKPCPQCGNLLPPGREIHSYCVARKPENREAMSKRMSELWQEQGWRSDRLDWWRSPEAEAFRAKTVELPCAHCGESVTRAEKRVGEHGRAFCNPGCKAQWEWRQGGPMARSALAGMPGGTRRRWKGKWNAQKGGRRFQPGHKPVTYTDEKRDKVLALRQRGMSHSEIAVAVFQNPGKRSLVRRILARHAP